MGKTAFLLAGQGSQYPGMGRELYESSGAVRRIFDEAEKVRPGTLKQMFEGSEEELKRTVNTQPCLFLADIAAAEALKESGIVPDMIAGFSLGEIAGLPVSGILSLTDAFRLVIKRGILMDEAAGKVKGSMLAVLKMDAGELEELCKEEGVYPVNYNCPGQVVVSGEADRIESLKEKLTAMKVRSVALSVSGPFHTPYMQTASDGLLRELTDDSYVINAPEIILYSNFAARPYPDDPEGIVKNITLQVSNSVRWEETLRHMLEAGADTFIECGPGTTLSGFVKRTCPGAKILNVCDAATLKNAAEVLRNA